MVMDAMLMVIKGFRHMMAREVLAVTARKGNSSKLERASVDAILETTRFWMKRGYMKRRKVTIS